MKCDLDYMLDSISVQEVDSSMNDANQGGLSALIGWYCVVEENGVRSYFSTESAALRHRLLLINLRLNPMVD